MKIVIIKLLKVYIQTNQFSYVDFVTEIIKFETRIIQQTISQANTVLRSICSWIYQIFIDQQNWFK